MININANIIPVCRNSFGLNQYLIYSPDQCRILNDDSETFRKCMHDGDFVLYQRINDEWEVIFSISSPGALRYREGNRNGSYVIDAALTVLAFNGVENTDWENIHISSIPEE